MMDKLKSNFSLKADDLLKGGMNYKVSEDKNKFKFKFNK